MFHKISNQPESSCQISRNIVYHEFMARRYQMDQREKKQAETRERIVDAAIELHQEKGIAATSMRDVADRASVGTVTVYRHFSDDRALLASCSRKYFERHPFPDLEAWHAVSDPEARLRQGLLDTYTFHRETAPMMASVIDEVRGTAAIEPYDAFWSRAAQILISAWETPEQDNPKLKAGIALAMRFETWHFLTVEQSLSDEDAADMMSRLSLACLD